MKPLTLSGCVFLLTLASGSWPTCGQVSSPVEALFPGPVMISPRPTGEPERPPLVTTVEWQDLVQRLDAIEARLGQATRPPSMAYNLERRLTDLEKRIQQLEQQQTQLQKLEPRLRRLEMK